MVAQQANAIADMIYNPQQQAIDSRIKLINDMTNARNQSFQQFGEQGRANVGQAYDTLQGLLGQNKDQAMSQLATAGNQIGQGYRDAQQIGTSLRDTSRAALAQLAQSMGAGDYAMPVIGGLEAEANQMIQNNANRDATVTGNLRNWAAQSGDVYNRQIGQGHQMRADALSRLESDLVRGIQESNLQGSEQVSDMHSKLAELLSQRGSHLAELVQQLSAQEFERSFKQAQLDAQAAEMSQRGAIAGREMDLKERAMAKEGQLSEKDKLAMQLQAWGMNLDQQNADRSHSLDQAKLRQAGQPDKLGMFNALMGARTTSSDQFGNPVIGGVDPSAMNLMYDLGLLDRPSSGRSGFGSAFTGSSGWGGGAGRTSSLGSTAGGRGTLASLRAAHSGLGIGRSNG